MDQPTAALLPRLGVGVLRCRNPRTPHVGMAHCPRTFVLERSSRFAASQTKMETAAQREPLAFRRPQASALRDTLP
eukprot:905951-Alexandrium_andersonii.AAC.1